MTILRSTTSSGALTFAAVLAAAIPSASFATDAPPSCAALVKDSAYGITGNPAIKSASSMVVPASAPHVAYCKVSLRYGTNPNQNINIVVGLPLSKVDGGSGGVEGAWNGRTEGLGGGGCAGNLSVTVAVDAGYVGSGNDLGHSGGDCRPGVNPNGTYNIQFIEDFIRNGIEQQVLWSKLVARVYYGIRPKFNYWSGCSTGGRQGYLKGSRNVADVTDTFGPLDRFKAHGGKMITWVGGNDHLIFPRGVINYYRQMAARYSPSAKPDFRYVQNFYRLFRAPGVAHCGGGTGPHPVDAFGALVKWVEHGEAPGSLLAAGGSAAPPSGRTRPLCPYPQTAIYKGTGDINDAANFRCGGNLETDATVCADVLVNYKDEVNGDLDYRGTGVSPAVCGKSGSRDPR